HARSVHDRYMLSRTLEASCAVGQGASEDIDQPPQAPSAVELCLAFPFWPQLPSRQRRCAESPKSLATNKSRKTVLNEFYRVAFRKKVYRAIEELQADLDLWVREYNEIKPHQGRWCFGKTPMQTFLTKTRSLNQAPSVRSSCG